MYCRYCGHEVENDSRFCLNCGKMISEEENKTNYENFNTVDTEKTINLEEEEKENKPLFSKNDLKSFFKISKIEYCTNCGSNMGKSKICPNCHHKKNNGINQYCTFCGARVENGKCSNSNVEVKPKALENLLRLISLFLICFSLVGVVVKITDGDYLSAVIMGGISLLCSIFVMPKHQIYKLKILLSSKNIKAIWICIVYVLVIIFVSVGIKVATTKTSELTGDNLAAYNLVSEVSYEFKNPSSVRLVSGTVFYDEEESEWCGWFALSATNGFGARTVGYYFVSYLDGDVFALDLEDNGTDASIKYAKTKDELDIEKINNALDKKWGESFKD